MRYVVDFMLNHQRQDVADPMDGLQSNHRLWVHRFSGPLVMPFLPGQLARKVEINTVLDTRVGKVGMLGFMMFGIA